MKSLSSSARFSDPEYQRGFVPIMIRFNQRFVALFFVAFGFVGLAQSQNVQADPTPTAASCTTTPGPGTVLRIFTAPSWCPHCVHQRDFMHAQGWDNRIPFVLNNGQ